VQARAVFPRSHQHLGTHRDHHRQVADTGKDGTNVHGVNKFD